MHGGQLSARGAWLEGQVDWGKRGLLAVGLPVVGLAVVAAVFGLRSASRGSGSGAEEAGVAVARARALTSRPG